MECNQRLYTHFDPLVLSTQAGFKKPDARIYQALLSRMACVPSECVLIDDLEKKCEWSSGSWDAWDTIHFARDSCERTQEFSC